MDPKDTDPLYLSLPDALKWRRERRVHPERQLKSGEYLLNRLEGRDHVSVTNDDKKTC